MLSDRYVVRCHTYDVDHDVGHLTVVDGLTTQWSVF